MSHLDENWKSFKRVANYKTTLLRENKLVSEQTESELSDADFSPEELADIEKEVAKRLAPSPTPAEPPLASTMPPTTDSFLGKPGAEAELQRIFSGEESFEPETPPTPAAAPYSPRRGVFTHGIEEVPDFDFDKFYKALDTHVGGAETSLVKHGKDYKFGREHQAAFDKLQSTSGASMEDFKLDPAELEKIRKTSKRLDIEKTTDDANLAGQFSTLPMKDVEFKLEYNDQEWQDFAKHSDKIVSEKNRSLRRRLDKGKPFKDMRVEDAIFEVAAERGLDPIQMATLIYIETKGNPRAVNYSKESGKRGAMGLLQVLNKDDSRQGYHNRYGMDIDKLWSCVGKAQGDYSGDCDVKHFVEVLANKFEKENKRYGGNMTTLERYLTHQQGDRGRNLLWSRAQSGQAREPYQKGDSYTWKGKEHTLRDPAERRGALYKNFPPKTGTHGVSREDITPAHFMYYYKNRIGGLEDAFRGYYADRLGTQPSPRKEPPVSEPTSELKIAPPTNPGKITYVLGDSHIEPGSTLRKRLKKRLEASGHTVRFIGERGMDFRRLKRKVENVKKNGDAGEIIVASMGGNVASHYKKQKDPTKSITKNTDKNLMPAIADMREMQDQGVKITVFGPPHAKGGRVTPQYQKGRQTVDRTMAERFGNAGIRYISVYDETARDIYDDHREPDGVHWKSSGKRMYGDFITSNLQ